MNLSQYTPAELGITGHYLRVHSKVAPGWLPIVHDVLDWAHEFRWDGRQTVAFTYRVPGVLEPIRGLAGIDEFVIEVGA